MPYFDRFDICEAHRLHAVHYHSGQSSDLYAKQCRISKYLKNGAETYARLSDNGKEIYRDLVYKDAEKVAEKLGREAGENAARWVIQDTWGGRVTRGAKDNGREFLRMLDDGDPALGLSPPSLSGEWADDETCQTLLWKCGIDPDAEEFEDYTEMLDELSAAWEDAASEAFYDTLTKSARAELEVEV